jgi:hypothetical protein
MFMMCMVSVVLPYVHLIFNVWLEYPELLLLRIAWVYSLNLALNTCPVCHMYFIVLPSRSNYYIQDCHLSYIHLLFVVSVLTYFLLPFLWKMTLWCLYHETSLISFFFLGICEYDPFF